MYTNKLLKKFCKERNIKNSTKKAYESALNKYSSFNNESIDKLIQEALTDEKNKIPLKERKIKNRLLNFRNYLLNNDMTTNTVKTYFSRIKTFYSHFEIEIPYLPQVKYGKSYQTNYLDLPTKKDIKNALEITSDDMKAIILFMSSSGTAKAETLSLTILDFINSTSTYHNGGSIDEVLKCLEKKDNIVPTFYLRRIKTDKFYYTFCSPEASKAIIKYLKSRKNLKRNDKLFDFSNSALLRRFKTINDQMNWGFKGKYRFFRTHTLRKFHASNIGLSAEYIDSLQGRGKNQVHEAYIKTNPKKLKEIYENAMKNVIIDPKTDDKPKIIEKQEFNIIINVFLSGKEYNIL